MGASVSILFKQYVGELENVDYMQIVKTEGISGATISIGSTNIALRRLV